MTMASSPSGVEYSYQWIRRDGDTDTDTDIEGATSHTYTVVEEDQRKQILVRVSFTDNDGYTETLTSDPTDPVPGPIIGGFVLGTDRPAGLWGNEETIWVLNQLTRSVRAFDRSTSRRDSTKDFTILNLTDSDVPRGIWSDGLTMFVTIEIAAVDQPSRIDAYKMSDQSLDVGKEFTLNSANTHPLGLWGSGTTLWVADDSDEIFAYRLASDSQQGTRDADKDLDGLNGAGNDNPWGIWSDDSTMFVTDEEDLKVYAYAVSDGSRQKIREFKLDDSNRDPRGAWGDGGTLYVVDVPSETDLDATLFSYELPFPATGVPTVSGDPRVGQTLTASHDDVDDTNGIPEDVEYSYEWIRRDGDGDTDIAGATGTTYTLVKADHGKKIMVRVSFTDGDGYREILTSDPTDTVIEPITDGFAFEAVFLVTGLWGNGTTLWVADITNKRVRAYDRSTGLPAPDAEFNTLSGAGNARPQGIWSDGETMFVADDDLNNAQIYAYDVTSKNPVTGKGFALNSANTAPQGIWSDGATLWVADVDADKIFAYKLTSGSDYGTRDSGKDFNTLAAGNDNPWGIWSDGPTMFVTGNPDDKVYAYAVSDGSRQEMRDFNLDPANVDPRGAWGRQGMLYVLNTASADNPATLFGYELSITPFLATGELTVRGDPLVGQTLTARLDNVEDDNGVPDDVEYSYQWIRRDTGTGTEIDGATDTTYTVVEADRGKQIVVRVSFIDSAGHAETLTSAPTDAVTGPITGGFVFGTDRLAGLWGNDETIWVVDQNTIRVWAFDRSTGLRHSDRDFNTLVDAGNVQPKGIWSDGETMFVADDKASAQIFAYEMSGKSLDTGKGFVLDSENRGAVGLWGDGATLWVADTVEDKIFAYRLAPGEGYGTRDPGKDIDGLAEARNNISWGIWSDGPTMFVTDEREGKVFAYAVSDGSRQEIREFKLDASNSTPVGAWGDGGTLYVANFPFVGGTGTLFSYELTATPVPATGVLTVSGVPHVGQTLTAGLDSVEDANGIPVNVEYSYRWIRRDGDTDADIDGATGVTYTVTADDVDSRIAVVVSFIDGDGYAETLTSDATETVIRGPLTGGFELHGRDNDNPWGIWGDDDTVWVSDQASDIYAYSRSTSSRDEDKEFSGNVLFSAGNAHRLGIWSDGTTMFVVDDADGMVYAYELSEMSRDSAKDIVLDESQTEARGIWGNGDTIWVSNDDHRNRDDAVLAYKRDSGEEYGSRDSDKDFSASTLGPASNTDVRGIASDGTTMWVADSFDSRLYAYKLSDQTRDPGKDVRLDTDNGAPGGVWASGGELWVVDTDDDKLYAYDLSPGGGTPPDDGGPPGDGDPPPDDGDPPPEDGGLPGDGDPPPGGGGGGGGGGDGGSSGGGSPDEPAEPDGGGGGPLSDLGDGGVHEPALRALASDGVFEGTGCGGGRLCPRERLLRWEMAVWLVRILDGDDPEPGDSAGFADVDDGAWWAPFVRRLAELGVTEGCSQQPRRFCGDEAVTRAQMASFLARAFDLPAADPAGFEDTAGVHAANIDALFAAGITVGCGRDPLRYCPRRATSRAHMATFLHRAQAWLASGDATDLADGGSHEPALRALATDGVLAGTGCGQGRLCPQGAAAALGDGGVAGAHPRRRRSRAG